MLRATSEFIRGMDDALHPVFIVDGLSVGLADLI